MIEEIIVDIVQGLLLLTTVIIFIFSVFLLDAWITDGKNMPIFFKIWALVGPITILLVISYLVGTII